MIRHAAGPALGALTTFARYFGVQVAGLCLDIGIAWSALQAGSSGPVAVAAGLVPSTLATFAAHEAWTFGLAGARGRAGRFAGYLGLALTAFTVRSLALVPLSAVLPGTGPQAGVRLLCATGISFLVGYVLAKALVFRAPRDARRAA